MSLSALRLRIWERDDKKCWYCGRPTVMHGDVKNPRLATIDHLIPRARGGTNDDTNVVSACKRCNELKGMLTEAEFRSMSTVDALIFNHAAQTYGLKNLHITEVAMSAGEGYRKPKPRASQERLQAAGYFAARAPNG
jgi:hypothetical protein